MLFKCHLFTVKYIDHTLQTGYKDWVQSEIKTERDHTNQNQAKAIQTNCNQSKQIYAKRLHKRTNLSGSLEDHQALS